MPIIIFLALLAGLIWWSYAAHEAEEELRLMKRYHEHAMDDIRSGRPTPVPVRLVR